MRCSIVELRTKEIINLNTGHRLGYVHDAEFSLSNGKLTALIVAGNSRCFGLLGRAEDTFIPWESIKKIGEDIILVEIEHEPVRLYEKPRRGF